MRSVCSTHLLHHLVAADQGAKAYLIKLNDHLLIVEIQGPNEKNDCHITCISHLFKESQKLYSTISANSASMRDTQANFILLWTVPRLLPNHEYGDVAANLVT